MMQKLISYIQESRQELNRVNWPTRQQTIHMTIVVIGISIAVAAFLGVIDSFFRYLLENLL